MPAARAPDAFSQGRSCSDKNAGTMKASLLSPLLAAVVLPVCVAIVAAAPVNVTGHWHVAAASGAEFYGGVMVLNQVGQTVIGRAGKSTITGTMASDTKMDAHWDGPKGAGWMTLYFSSNGNGFRGEWGFNGRKADGTFIGKRMADGAAQCCLFSKRGDENG